MKIVVTGGTGFIGSHLVKKLVEKKKEVVVIDDFSNSSMENLFNLNVKPSDFKLQKLDLTDYNQTLKAIKGAGTVFHLAARIGGIKYLHGSDRLELLTLQENLTIDANVFRACQSQGVKKIIYASSSAVYPMDKQYSFGTILSEKDLSLKSNLHDLRFKFRMSINPDGGYGMAKLLGEVQLNLVKDMCVGVVRIFNVYGVNEPINEKSHAIFDLIRKSFIYPKKKFIVWGDGSQTRDYVYVSDCVDSLLKLEKKISNSQKSPLIVNVGSGRAVSIKELAEKIIKLSGKDIKPVYDLKKPVGPLSRTADMNKVKKILKWQPKISIDEGLKKTYFWLQKKLK